MRTNKLIIASFSVFMLMACNRDGCTDQSAINYDSKAKNDDGSCVFDDTPGGGTTGPGGQTLPIKLTGNVSDITTIKDISTDPNVIEYYIDGAWNIDAAVVIEAGVRIEMRSGARILVKANGSLNATGTPSNKINIAGSQNTSGYWYNIEFNSNNPNNKLIYCNVSNGSKYYGSEPGMIMVSDNSQVTIQNSSFSKGSDFGLMTQGENAKLPDFHSNHFSSFSKAPIRLASLNHTGYLDNNTILASDNTIQSVYVYGEDVNSNTTVPKMNFPYSIRERITFYNSQTIVQEGVEIQMAADTRFKVTSNASLEFSGTAANPCKVIGEQSSKGFWYDVSIDSNNPNNKFSHTSFSGGRNYYGSETGFIRLNGTANLSMNNCDISNSPTEAIQGPASVTFNDNGGNSWTNCDGGGGLLP